MSDKILRVVCNKQDQCDVTHKCNILRGFNRTTSFWTQPALCRYPHLIFEGRFIKPIPMQIIDFSRTSLMAVRTFYEGSSSS